MGRKGYVVLKKAEKLEAVDAALPSGSSPEDYITKFRGLYPEDWDNIVRKYNEHERRTPAGKSHPMPEPKQYVLNMVKTFLNKKKAK